MRDRIHDLAESLVASLASEAYGHAVSAVPVDTGELRDSIVLSSSGLSASVSASASHAAFVELGSSACPARPYLLPALRFAQGRIASLAGGHS